MTCQSLRPRLFGAGIALFVTMLIPACSLPASDLTVEIDPGTDVVSIVVGNDGDNVREVDDQFLRDYAGPRSPLQLTIGRGEKTLEQCRSMDYLGPPKVTSIPPGSEFKLQTGISALVHTFCIYDPGTYSLKASLGSTPILRTLSLRSILGQRSVHVQAQALQP